MKLYGHFHPPCVLHPGSAYTTCSSAVSHFQIEGERESGGSAHLFISFPIFSLSRVIRSPLSSLASILRFFTSNLLNHPHTSNSARSGGDQRHLWRGEWFPPSPRAQKYPLLVVFSTPFPGVLLFLWISSSRSSAGDSTASIGGKVPKRRSGHSPIVPPLFRSWPAARWRFCSCLRRSWAWSLPGTSSTRTTRTRNSRLRQRFCPGMEPSAPVTSPCLAAFSMRFWGRIFYSG